MPSRSDLVFHFLLLLLLIADSQSEDKAKTHCDRVPNPFPFRKNMVVHKYNASAESLLLDFTDILYKFCDDFIYNNHNQTHQGGFRVDLISTSRRSVLKDKCELGTIPRDTIKDSKSRLQATVHNLNPSNPVTFFNYVQGRYFIRLSDCFGEDCKVVACSKVISLEPLFWKDESVCEMDPSEHIGVEVKDITQLFDFHTCSVSVQTLVPLCSVRQSYNQAKVFTVEMMNDTDQNCTLQSFLDKADLAENTTIPVLPCNNQTSLCSDATSVNYNHLGVLSHSLYSLSRNSSYCVYYQMQNSLCELRKNSKSSFKCFFTSPSPLHCQQMEQNSFSLFTEPMFIGVVSLTLVLSLALLMWTVVQCSRKRPETPVQQPIKKPPRSLTEDDLEHISRLPSQEIVLVYFPDTTRFKDLNRKFRDWLITLDVNDVKDIYDEKCSEAVLKDPESWVRSALAGPEKRIILVCSRLAYECLVTIKKGISSPKFVETDPHFGLLTRTIQYLDKEMKGNYRNLICVRYEDLKICDRAYSSEAFNIVPGTEYVLPQHLEDVYRWIHPRDPKPECWSESRQEVRELLETMRKYRHHDDNVFSVQFNTNGGVSNERTSILEDQG